MNPAARAAAGGSFVRYAILAPLALAPALAGAVHPPVYTPLLVACALLGLLALQRGRGPAPPAALPGLRLLLAFHALVLVQLIPLPPGLLRAVSPGSWYHYDRLALLPLVDWRPISVSPPDTLRGLAFLAAFSLFALAVLREMTGQRWRRRLLATVVGAGLFITVVAFVQAVSPQPRRLYGLWQPRWDWAVFGPYVNRSHFAGYVVMALPLALGFALERWERLLAAWRRRRHGLLALGDPEGGAAIRASVVVMVLVAGLLASGSRGGIAAFGATALLLPLVAQKRRRTALAVAALCGLGLAWVGLGGFLTAMQARGVRGSRLDLWRDMLPMAPRFPLFGDGFNAFATAYPFYQTIWRTEWIGEAHDEYLQVLLDTGLLGAALFAAFFVIVLRRALARATSSPLDLGAFGALVALAVHNLVEFNWQIPANALTWVAVAALACRERDHREPAHEIP